MTPEQRDHMIKSLEWASRLTEEREKEKKAQEQLKRYCPPGCYYTRDSGCYYTRDSGYY
jgi:hypothetical protein